MRAINIVANGLIIVFYVRCVGGRECNCCLSVGRTFYRLSSSTCEVATFHAEHTTINIVVNELSIALCVMCVLRRECIAVSSG